MFRYLVLSVTASLMLAGCMYDSFPADWAEAEATCEFNDGVDRYTSSWIHCANGAMFNRG